MLTRFTKTLWVLIVVVANAINSGAQSVEFDKKIGLEASEQIASEMGIYQGKQTSVYVNEIGNRLVGRINNTPFKYNFSIVDMAEPNAFALPGGHIYISRGLLSLTNSEDEIAGILGHEITHSELRHGVKQMKRGIVSGILSIPGALVGVVINEDLGNLINTPINASSELFLASYSRKHEKQADNGGTGLMAAAGYNPHHFPQVLDNLSKLLENITGEKEEFTYFDSHPYTPKRVSYLNKTIEGINFTEKENIAKNSEEFLGKIDGICAGVNPDNGVFRGNDFLHPKLNLFVSFPKTWVTDNKPVAVGAIDTADNQNLIVLGVAKEQKTPKELGKRFVEDIKKAGNYKPERAEPFSLNGMPAYVVSVKDNTSGKVYGIHNLWFTLNKITYQVIGIAKESDYELLVKTAKSIRPLKQAERENIQVSRLRVVKAQQGETIESLCNRTRNVWDAELTAIMNNVKPDVKFSEGQLVKVVVKEKY